MLITTEGIIIQLRCEEISTYGRITSGVKLINLKNGETVKKIAKVRQTEKNNEEATEESEETDETKEVANTQEAEGTEETSNNEEES